MLAFDAVGSVSVLHMFDISSLIQSRHLSTSTLPDFVARIRRPYLDQWVEEVFFFCLGHVHESYCLQGKDPSLCLVRVVGEKIARTREFMEGRSGLCRLCFSFVRQVFIKHNCGSVEEDIQARLLDLAARGLTPLACELFRGHNLC